MKKIIISLILVISFVLPIYAQTSVSELIGEDNPQQEPPAVTNGQEREEQFKGQLNLLIPDYSDNPSHIITFTDPSEDKKGVELDIDEKGYRQITNPYSLPALSIGSHTLKFRFNDDIGATKVYETSLIILPRPPIVKAPQLDNNNLLISGTSIVGSKVIVALSVNSNNFTTEAITDSTGNWSTTIEFDTPPMGIVTVFAYSRSKGYASNLSEAVVFSASDIEIVQEQKSGSDISFNLKDIDLSSLPNILSSNPDLIIVSVIILFVGFLLGIFLTLLFKRTPRVRVSRDVAKKVKEKKIEERTLKEIFAEDSKVEKTEEEKQNDKIFTKRDFLKDFNKFDPDDKQGKEKKKPSKKDKEEVVVTLTSKEEE